MVFVQMRPSFSSRGSPAERTQPLCQSSHGRSATERDQYVTRCQCLPPAGLLEERLQRVEVIVVGGRRRGRCGRRGRRSRRRSLGRWWWCGRLWWRWRRWGRDGARRRRGGCRRRRALRRRSTRVPALVVVVLDWDDDLLDLVIKVLIFLKSLDGAYDGKGIRARASR